MPWCSHQHLTTPSDPDAKIWRYMDIPKLLSILVDNALFFPSGKTLSKNDKFEGQPTYAEVDQLNFLATPPSEEELKTVRDEMLANYRQAAPEEQKRHMAIIENISFFNCWHLNDEESDAMWKIYGKNDNGVAIRSTIRRLTKSLNATEKCVYTGQVRYYTEPDDNLPNPENYVWRFMRKKMAFQHEKEVRAVVTDGTQFGKPGVAIPIYVSELIDTVVISPYAETWIERLVKSVACRLGYKFDVVPSEAARDIPSTKLLPDPGA